MRRLSITLLLALWGVVAAAQEVVSVYAEGYGEISNMKPGKYDYKSTQERFIARGPKVEPVKFMADTAELGRWRYFVNEDPFALFSTPRPKDERDVAGVLTGPSMAVLDTVFYYGIYNAGEWDVTWDVWYAVRIDGKRYYTDYKIHDYVADSTYLPEKEQLFMLYAQSTGYDEYYDMGYPDYFHAAVWKKTRRGWRQVFFSRELDLNPEMDEYWDQWGQDVHIIEENGDLTLRYSGTPIRMTWDGKTLKCESE